MYRSKKSPKPEYLKLDGNLGVLNGKIPFDFDGITPWKSKSSAKSMALTPGGRETLVSLALN